MASIQYQEVRDHFAYKRPYLSKEEDFFLLHAYFWSHASKHRPVTQVHEDLRTSVGDA